MTTRRQVGRRRDERVDAAIVAACRQLLAEAGYGGITMDAVAARAGVGKAAIYRRYAGKQEMVFAAAVHDLTIIAPADSGSLRADLTALCADIAASLTTIPAPSLLGLLADITADPASAARIQEAFVETERACVTEVLERAVRRGELPAVPDLTAVHALLTGSMLSWILMLHRTDRRTLDEFAATIADLVTTTLTARPPQPSPAE
ncbi:TetR/AcrR family transcriptional regulator [Actinomadura sp. NPDC047616]|uniref:TetR/AcrR family transcriptional regulator n=1 Tax=Actinomadura sp. NPDC047616 TaxID=3155914 RepID=UPI0034037437